MALHSLYCADVPLRNCSLTHSVTETTKLFFFLLYNFLKPRFSFHFNEQCVKYRTNRHNDRSLEGPRSLQGQPTIRQPFITVVASSTSIFYGSSNHVNYLEISNWTGKWVVHQEPFLVHEFPRTTVVWRTKKSKVQTILQVLFAQRQSHNDVTTWCIDPAENTICGLLTNFKIVNFKIVFIRRDLLTLN